MTGKRRDDAGLQQAFDAARFGPARTLNLRASLPTGIEAAKRLENWLRQQQVQKATDVLVITGRGNNSEGGIAVVRQASISVFHDLRRKGVITGFAEHTAGSFVVDLAPMRDLLDAARRRRKPQEVQPANPPTLAHLEAETLQALRVLAEHSLDELGTRMREPFVEHEMLRLFGQLAATVREGPDRERRLRAAILAAQDEFD